MRRPYCPDHRGLLALDAAGRPVGWIGTDTPLRSGWAWGQQYLKGLATAGLIGNLAKTTNTVIMPSNVADVAGLIATAMSTVREIK